MKNKKYHGFKGSKLCYNNDQIFEASERNVLCLSMFGAKVDSEYLAYLFCFSSLAILSLFNFFVSYRKIIMFLQISKPIILNAISY